MNNCKHPPHSSSRGYRNVCPHQPQSVHTSKSRNRSTLSPGLSQSACPHRLQSAHPKEPQPFHPASRNCRNPPPRLPPSNRPHRLHATIPKSCNRFALPPETVAIQPTTLTAVRNPEALKSDKAVHRLRQSPLRPSDSIHAKEYHPPTHTTMNQPHSPYASEKFRKKSPKIWFIL